MNYKREAFELIANKIKSFGFRVFVHNTAGDSLYYGFYSDGQNVGYFDASGYFFTARITTVNAPGSFCSGFAPDGIDDDGTNPEKLTPEILRAAFVVFPSWVNRFDRKKKVYKYRDLADFLARSWSGKNGHLVEI